MRLPSAMADVVKVPPVDVFRPSIAMSVGPRRPERSPAPLGVGVRIDGGIDLHAVEDAQDAATLLPMRLRSECSWRAGRRPSSSAQNGSCTRVSVVIRYT